MRPAYFTALGRACCGDARELLRALPDESVNLVVTSPPFALRRKKDYGNEDQADYVDWLLGFARLVQPKLRGDGSFVVDLGGAYRRGVPSRSLYNFRFAIRMVDELGFHLAQDLYWFNPSRLPSPIEWVNKRKIRVKDAVDTVWWFSKTPFPQADVRNVLVEYSARMKKLLRDPDAFYQPKRRPSGHDISRRFAKDNGGAIPSNLLQIPNTESNGRYLAGCKLVGVKGHPARFPARLPAFFVKLLTRPGDLVVDCFGGSNTTGQVAEALGRRWLCFEQRLDYLAASALRFAPAASTEAEQVAVHAAILAGEAVDLSARWPQDPPD